MVSQESARWSRLGKQIRAEREKAGLSLDDLSEATGISGSMLSAMERGQRGIKRSHIVKIDRALGTKKILEGAWDGSARVEVLPPWFREAAARERAAKEIRQYAALFIPGLLQTLDYSRALLRSGLPAEPQSRIEQLAAARIDRQALLTGDDPPRLLVVVDEMALRRPVGGDSVMRDQLDRLLAVTDGPYPVVQFQVIPFDTVGHPGLSNDFVLYEIDGGSLLWVETRRTGDATQQSEMVNDYLRHFANLQGAALPLSLSRRLISDVWKEFK
ncbi:helix-turn-helix transcriptional regulator [Nocardiopsis sp. CNT-189]|uniref:helix-turn-helix domain-containing protein n=1 Tax=Nocardiopsis oceanisediminis TaxID=2816862 RepID=UPI003B30F38F